MMAASAKSANLRRSCARKWAASAVIWTAGGSGTLPSEHLGNGADDVIKRTA
jgi:hypothetical protein